MSPSHLPSFTILMVNLSKTQKKNNKKIPPSFLEISSSLVACLPACLPGQSIPASSFAFILFLSLHWICFCEGRMSLFLDSFWVRKKSFLQLSHDPPFDTSCDQKKSLIHSRSKGGSHTLQPESSWYPMMGYIYIKKTT